MKKKNQKAHKEKLSQKKNKLTYFFIKIVKYLIKVNKSLEKHLISIAKKSKVASVLIFNKESMNIIILDILLIL